MAPPQEPPSSGLFERQPIQLVVRDLVRRAGDRLRRLGDVERVDLLEDAIYWERKRLEKDEPEEGERDRLDRLARAVVHGDEQEQVQAALSLVAAWGEEIHGRFSERVYKVGTRVLPRALGALLSAKPKSLRDWDLHWEQRLRLGGDLERLQELAREATLVLVPTHVSNLDSPLIGLALFKAGLPPFVYGAGLNLFANPLLGFWLRRLGAYTVDRRKQARLYKLTLKDYSVRCLTTRHHSLFFPGGTRARSGAIETSLKKGLLGTGVVAWQEMLDKRSPRPEVYFVPLTLSFQLVLEASTLIDDHLAEAGRQRYIITDDEFSRPAEVASFGRRVLDLDDTVIAHFGDALDCLGNPVPADAEGRAQAAVRRRRYVCDADGNVEWDEQRDHVYTERLADAIVAEYPKGASIMSTHLAAWVGWRFLEEARGHQDPFRLVRIDPSARRIPRGPFTARLGKALAQVRSGAEAGKWQETLPPDVEGVLALALDRFGRYHKTRALTEDGDDIVVEDPKLCLYYRNRAVFANLEA